MNQELQVAKQAAVEAGNLILSYYKSDYEIKDKGYHNPVTTADKASDKKIKDILTTTFPEYGWLSEETVDSKERLKNKRVWVVDPLDGTKEFIEGVPHFVVSIGLVEDGIPIVGLEPSELLTLRDEYLDLIDENDLDNATEISKYSFLF